ncbi:hypothetical protein [Chondrinema litorale]|uniref:hypothetical protein n=1 Tax=Chondrinema litorale TaxID=2994555 RepID=UPI0025434EED|nr:hypothetical protein [Chondrinema litorale]UZR93632.1 hypothetical protein OQ292_17420 [Chondrinema litorale]
MIYSRFLLLISIFLIPYFTVSAQRLTRESYLSERDKLLKSDSLISFDAAIELSTDEMAANEKLMAFKAEMMADFKKANYFPPAHVFYDWRDDMYKSKLFEILKAMPKGGIHHLHPVTMQDFKWIADQAVLEEHCYVYWADDTKEYIKGQIRFFKDGKEPTGFKLASKLNKEIPQFKEELFDLLTFDVSAYDVDFKTWVEFEKSFKRVGGFYSYKPMFKKFYRQGIQNMIDDGVHHLELRVIPKAHLYDLTGKEAKGDLVKEEEVLIFWKELEEEFKEENPNFSIKLIYTSLRFFNEASVLKEIDKAYQLRKKYPELISGFDLVAEEDAGNTTLFFLNNWVQMEEMEKKYGIDLPLYLHDGESDWPDNKNLYDAVILSSKRIGHGFNLFRFPTLQKMIKEQQVCIEVNPLSNQILDYLRDLRIHPAVYYMNQGIQISISPDDPGVFDYVGVTPDYWAIFLAWGLDVRSLKKLVYNSIDYSSLNSYDKQSSREYLDKQWASWIKYVNTTL